MLLKQSMVLCVPPKFLVFAYSSLAALRSAIAQEQSIQSNLMASVAWKWLLGWLLRAGLVESGITLSCALLNSGVLVPGGFGVRGTEGKIQAIAWARKQKKPFLGKE